MIDSNMENVLASSGYQSGEINGSLPQRREAGGQVRFLIGAALVVTILLWAASFPAIKVALVAYSPAEVAFVRYLIASLLLGCYALFARMPLPRRRDLPLIALCGFIGFTLYNYALNRGEVTVTAGAASFIISSEIAIIALLAQLFYGERLGRAGWLGVFLCLLGVAVISFGPGDSLRFSWGAVLVFVATLSISVYSLIQKPLLQRYSAIQFTSYAIWAGTLFLFVFAPAGLSSVFDAPVAATLAVAFLGVFPGVVAYACWSYVLSKIPAGQAGSYLAVIPVVALVISWLWLGEIPALVALLGSGVVFAGVLLVNRRSIASVDS